MNNYFNLELFEEICQLYKNGQFYQAHGEIEGALVSYTACASIIHTLKNFNTKTLGLADGTQVLRIASPQAEYIRRVESDVGPIRRAASDVGPIRRAASEGQVLDPERHREPLVEELQTESTAINCVEFDCTDVVINQCLEKLNIIYQRVLANIETLQKLLKQQKQKYKNNDDDDEEKDWEKVCEKIKPKIFKGGDCIFFKDLGGLKDEKDMIKKALIFPLVYPNLYPKIGKGFLLFGPPGTGKTLLAKAAVNQLQIEDPNVGVLFFTPTGATLKGKFVGETEKKIVEAFTCAHKAACECENPNGIEGRKKYISVIFIDEMDSVAGDRSDDPTGLVANSVNTLLQMMDGMGSFKNVVVIGATNYPWKLDAAILRRFDTQILLDIPKPNVITDIMNLEFYSFAKIKKYKRDMGCETKKDTENDGKKAQEASICDKGCEMSNDKTDINTPPYSYFKYQYIDALNKNIIRAYADEMASKPYYFSSSDVNKVMGEAKKMTATAALENTVFYKLQKPYFNAPKQDMELLEPFYFSSLVPPRDNATKIKMYRKYYELLDKIIGYKITDISIGKQDPNSLINIQELKNMYKYFYLHDFDKIKTIYIEKDKKIYINSRLLIDKDPEINLNHGDIMDSFIYCELNKIVEIYNGICKNSTVDYKTINMMNVTAKERIDYYNKYVDGNKSSVSYNRRDIDVIVRYSRNIIYKNNVEENKKFNNLVNFDDSLFDSLDSIITKSTTDRLYSVIRIREDIQTFICKIINLFNIELEESEQKKKSYYFLYNLLHSDMFNDIKNFEVPDTKILERVDKQSQDEFRKISFEIDKYLTNNSNYMTTTIFNILTNEYIIGDKTSIKMSENLLENIKCLLVAIDRQINSGKIFNYDINYFINFNGDSEEKKSRMIEYLKKKLKPINGQKQSEKDKIRDNFLKMFNISDPVLQKTLNNILTFLLSTKKKSTSLIKNLQNIKVLINSYPNIFIDKDVDEFEEETHEPIINCIMSLCYFYIFSDLAPGQKLTQEDIEKREEFVLNRNKYFFTKKDSLKNIFNRLKNILGVQKLFVESINDVRKNKEFSNGLKRLNILFSNKYGILSKLSSLNYNNHIENLNPNLLKLFFDCERSLENNTTIPLHLDGDTELSEGENTLILQNSSISRQISPIGKIKILRIGKEIYVDNVKEVGSQITITFHLGEDDLPKESKNKKLINGDKCSYIPLNDKLKSSNMLENYDISNPSKFLDDNKHILQTCNIHHKEKQYNIINKVFVSLNTKIINYKQTYLNTWQEWWKTYGYIILLDKKSDENTNGCQVMEPNFDKRQNKAVRLSGQFFRPLGEVIVKPEYVRSDSKSIFRGLRFSDIKYILQNKIYVENTINKFLQQLTVEPTGFIINEEQNIYYNQICSEDNSNPLKELVVPDEIFEPKTQTTKLGIYKKIKSFSAEDFPEVAIEDWINDTYIQQSYNPIPNDNNISKVYELIDILKMYVSNYEIYQKIITNQKIGGKLDPNSQKKHKNFEKIVKSFFISLHQILWTFDIVDNREHFGQYDTEEESNKILRNIFTSPKFVLGNKIKYLVSASRGNVEKQKQFYNDFEDSDHDVIFDYDKYIEIDLYFVDLFKQWRDYFTASNLDKEKCSFYEFKHLGLNDNDLVDPKKKNEIKKSVQKIKGNSSTAGTRSNLGARQNFLDSVRILMCPGILGNKIRNTYSEQQITADAQFSPKIDLDTRSKYVPDKAEDIYILKESDETFDATKPNYLDNHTIKHQSNISNPDIILKQDATINKEAYCEKIINETGDIYQLIKEKDLDCLCSLRIDFGAWNPFNHIFTLDDEEMRYFKKKPYSFIDGFSLIEATYKLENNNYDISNLIMSSLDLNEDIKRKIMYYCVTLDVRDVNFKSVIKTQSLFLKTVTTLGSKITNILDTKKKPDPKNVLSLLNQLKELQLSLIHYLSRLATAIGLNYTDTTGNNKIVWSNNKNNNFGKLAQLTSYGLNQKSFETIYGELFGSLPDADDDEDQPESWPSYLFKNVNIVFLFKMVAAGVIPSPWTAVLIVVSLLKFGSDEYEILGKSKTWSDVFANNVKSFAPGIAYIVLGYFAGDFITRAQNYASEKIDSTFYPGLGPQGVSYVNPGAVNATQTVIPGAVNATQAVIPSAVNATQAVIPSVVNATQTVIPGAVNATQTVIPGAVNATQTVIPGAVNATGVSSTQAYPDIPVGVAGPFESGYIHHPGYTLSQWVADSFGTVEAYNNSKQWQRALQYYMHGSRDSIFNLGKTILDNKSIALQVGLTAISMIHTALKQITNQNETSSVNYNLENSVGLYGIDPIEFTLKDAEDKKTFIKSYSTTQQDPNKLDATWEISKYASQLNGTKGDQLFDTMKNVLLKKGGGDYAEYDVLSIHKPGGFDYKILKTGLYAAASVGVGAAMGVGITETLDLGWDISTASAVSHLLMGASGAYYIVRTMPSDIIDDKHISEIGELKPSQIFNDPELQEKIKKIKETIKIIDIIPQKIKEAFFAAPITYDEELGDSVRKYKENKAKFMEDLKKKKSSS